MRILTREETLRHGAKPTAEEEKREESRGLINKLFKPKRDYSDELSDKGASVAGGLFVGKSERIRSGVLSAFERVKPRKPKSLKRKKFRKVKVGYVEERRRERPRRFGGF